MFSKLKVPPIRLKSNFFENQQTKTHNALQRNKDFKLKQIKHTRKSVKVAGILEKSMFTVVMLP